VGDTPANAVWKRRVVEVQLCDRPEQAEAADRLKRIASCLDQMDQLSNLEQRTKQLLTSDDEALRSLLRQ
jgi:glutaredoxin 2